MQKIQGRVGAGIGNLAGGNSAHCFVKHGSFLLSPAAEGKVFLQTGPFMQDLSKPGETAKGKGSSPALHFALMTGDQLDDVLCCP